MKIVLVGIQMNDLGISTLRRPWFIIHLAADKSTTRIPFRLPPPRWCSAINRISDHYQDRLPHVPAPDSKATKRLQASRTPSLRLQATVDTATDLWSWRHIVDQKRNCTIINSSFPRRVFAYFSAFANLQSRIFDALCQSWRSLWHIFHQIGWKSRHIPSDWKKKQKCSIRLDEKANIFHQFSTSYTIRWASSDKKHCPIVNF